MTNWPKISIVTPTFNQGQYIEQTIQSILNQNYPNLEYIIIDGGSTDSTLDIIKKYEKHLTYWISESDRGQAHAINKGLEKSTGEIFQWINSDDYMEEGALFKIAAAFLDPKVDVVAGKTVYFENGVFEEPIQQSLLSSSGLLFWQKGVKFVQPGVWLRLKYIKQSGGIDEEFHFSFDWDLYIRYLCRFKRIKYIDGILVYFRLHKQSKTVASLEKFHNEEILILNKLSKQNNLPELKNPAKKRLIRKDWYNVVEKMIQNKQLSKFARVRNLVIPCLKNPSQKWNRITLGAIKQIILK